jgi:hypothetical protein
MPPRSRWPKPCWLAGCEYLAVRNAGQKREALLLGAIAQQQGRALPVDNPMRADRSARRQQFLGHDIAFEHIGSPPP